MQSTPTGRRLYIDPDCSIEPAERTSTQVTRRANRKKRLTVHYIVEHPNQEGDTCIDWTSQYCWTNGWNCLRRGHSVYRNRPLIPPHYAAVLLRSAHAAPDPDPRPCPSKTQRHGPDSARTCAVRPLGGGAEAVHPYAKAHGWHCRCVHRPRRPRSFAFVPGHCVLCFVLGADWASPAAGPHGPRARRFLATPSVLWSLCHPPRGRPQRPLNRRRLPSNRRRLPSNRRQLPSNRRRLPSNRFAGTPGPLLDGGP